MLNLGDFFAPLNIYNVFILFVFVFCAEVVGYRFVSYFSKTIPTYLRGSIWLLGLGLIIFLYFLSHFPFPYNGPALIVILITTFILSIRFYLKDKGLKSLVSFFKENKIPLIIILIILPKVIIKASLPPYLWDEMAYHYISPYTLNFEKNWQILNSFYQNLPRLLETLYIALFSLSKTYAISRLIHFMIFISALLSVHTYLRQKFNTWTAILFFIATLFYGENFLLWSTLGYVDVGTTSFVMISLISFIDFYFLYKKQLLLFSLAFMGMAIGSKYSAITQLLSLSIITLWIFLFKRKLNFLKNKLLISSFILLIIMGGYWYIKSFIFTGNPIYPFLFGCKFSSCETMSLTYTNVITLSNAQLIFSKVFLGNKFLETMFGISIFLITLMGNSFTRKMLIIIFTFIIVEIVLVRSISGYDVRYFYHWQILAILIIIMPLGLLKLKKI